jgi:hypothetical protein
MQQQLITFPGPGGSRISCCIIPLGCLVVLLVGLFLGGACLLLHLRHRAQVAQVPPAPRLAGPGQPTAVTWRVPAR